MGLFDAFKGYQTRATKGDFTPLNNTVLSPTEEAMFQAFVQATPRAGRDLYDYDMRGAWKADAHAAGNGHLPDTWKKPNHPTFSTGSQYSSQEQPGGAWSQLPSGEWQFSAAPANLKWRSADDLKAYFNGPAEQGRSRLVLPK